MNRTGTMASAQQAESPGTKGINSRPVLGLVGAILGFITSWIGFLGLVLSGAGLALCVVALRNDPKGASGEGVATAGFALGILGLLLSLTFTTCQVMYFSKLTDDDFP